MPISSAPFLEVSNFSMSFGETPIIQDLSFSVGATETFGLLGSNGSGKTTTIRALLGLYTPTKGTLHVHGKPFAPDGRISLGYLPEERGLYAKEPALDIMIYFGSLKGLSRPAARAWSKTYLERVGLADKEKTRIDKLSSGQQQKIQLGVTLMGNPQLLILDEPTKGFDPINRRLLLEIIAESKQAGATVLMVTHYMEEVERLCDRILLLKNGSASAYGSLAEVKQRFGGEVFRVHHTGIAPKSSLYTIAASANGITDFQANAGVHHTQILEELVKRGVEIAQCAPHTKSLDDIFVEVYGTPSESDLS